MELIRALAVLVESPGPEAARLADLLELPPPAEPEEHTELFLRQLYPYASVYLGPEGMLGGVARDRVAGLWRALGESPPEEPDHLATLLGLYARLSELEGEAARQRHADAWRRARRTLLHEHLSSWLPPWLQRLRELGGPFHAAWAELLARSLGEEAADLEPPTGPPAHFRDMPPLPDPSRAGAEEFLDALLGAGRSGMIVARADLVRAARELGLGLRAGERRYTLEALLSQDAAAVLDWLRREAEDRGRRHGEGACWRHVPEAVVAHWKERARTTAASLRRAAEDEAPPSPE